MHKLKTPTHKHHIIPKHAGGTDDPTNIIELTVEDHADAHKKLYEKYNRWQDYLAWQGLSGRMGKEDIIRAKTSAAHKGKKLTPEHVEILREKGKNLIGDKNPMFGRTFNMTEQAKEKISKSMMGKNKGNIPWNKGKTDVFDESSKTKMSEKAISRHKSGLYDYEKLRLSRIGFKQPDSQKQAVSKALSKNWQITSPSGDITIINNLNKFCKDNNLDQGNLSRGSYKGWKCIKLSD